ncbi:nucleotidyltransferase domain-containing protein [Methanoculleus chikugoensis]|uniref:nucleotidyltransferase domain-containing protein n=1 Tax=Methanoculleus chikugoensis TaxID=118126 RepID=UPI0006D1F36D|nr:nucleotidyltransferase domain-containing protein [Methanoculleus chikugoensis]
MAPRITELLEHFREVLPSIRGGILIYGSHVKGYADERSDIDICLILHESADRAPVYGRMLTAGERYDIVIFDEIPWYLRGGAVLEAHAVLYADNPDDLDYWLYRQLAVWRDMKHRQVPVSSGDLLRRVRS